MDGYTTEDEQVEVLKRWWSENGKSAIFGIVLGLAAIFGWREWQGHISTQSETASQLYQEALTAAGQNNVQQARDKANAILGAYDNTGYAVFARLMLAQLAVQEGNYTDAEQQLNGALGATDNLSLQHEITLRLARVLLAGNKADQALTVLNKPDYGAFAAGYNELKGDAYAQQNKPAEARQAYQQAISESQGSGGDLSILNLKLDMLGQAN